ncbi:hypothetical protein SeMB42_g07924, partial [Synchytrium endobioticum]
MLGATPEHDSDSTLLGTAASTDDGSSTTAEARRPTPVIPSRRSFAFQLMASAAQSSHSRAIAGSKSRMVKPLSKRNLVGPDVVRHTRDESVDTPNDLPQNTSARHSAAGSKDDVFLCEPSQSFSTVWTHPVLRWYFLMFLFFTDHHRIYFFRMDTIQYRSDYNSFHASARRVHAQRIFNKYLARNAPLSIKLWKVEKISVRKALVACQANIDHPEPGLFDDLAYIALRNLENVHDGCFDEDGAAAPVRDDASCGSLKSQSDHAAQSFRESAFHQAMQNDLRGTRQLTTVQYQRAAERIMDMPPGYFDEPEVWDKFAAAVGAMGLDCDAFRQRLGAENTKDASRRRRSTNLSVRRGKTSTSLESSSNTAATASASGSPDDANPSANSSGKIKDPMKRDLARLRAPGVASDRSDLEHAFVQYVDNDMEFCEYCFKSLVHPNADDGNAAYRCETCRYVCHKGCRMQMKISCIKIFTAEDAPGGEEGSEKLRRVADKIQAFQHEIDIEMRIRDGMERMISAKNALTGFTRNNKPTPQELEMTALMEKSNNKLDILKHGLQKCNVQPSTLTAGEAQQAHASCAGPLKVTLSQSCGELGLRAVKLEKPLLVGTGDSPVHHTSSHDDADAKRIQRQKQVTHELLETEQDY